MGIISKEAQAAHQVAINMSSVTFLICTGLGMACTVRVGNRLGEFDISGMRKAGVSAIIQVIVFMAICALIFVVFRNFLPLIYIQDPDVVSIASFLLIMAAIFQIPDGVQVVALGALRGLQDVKVPTLITFIAYWVVGLPVSYLTAFTFDLGPMGIWLGLVLGLSISSALLTWRFLSKTNQLV
jgi:MATE family multidrug resistance protein